MLELLDTLWQLVVLLSELVVQILYLALQNLLLLVFLAWALLAVNWKRMWPTLAQGAWAPVVLIMLLSALVWSKLQPVETGNFWWQLGSITVVVLVTLFLGWLQGLLGWTAPDLSFEPPADTAHGHPHHHH